jgi:hypothetical protein
MEPVAMLELHLYSGTIPRTEHLCPTLVIPLTPAETRWDRR